MNATTSINRKELTLQQTAERLGFSFYRVELLAEAGHLQARRQNGEWLISDASICAFEGGRSRRS